VWPAEGLAGTGRATLFVVVGMQRVECGAMSGQGRRGRWFDETLQETPLPMGATGEQAVQAVHTALHNLQALPSLPRIGDVRVVVADAWLALSSVLWSRSSKRASTAASSARVQLAEAGFDIDPADAIRVDDAPFEQPRLAVAYPAAMLSTFRDVARRLDARLTSVLPMSSVVWAVTERESRYEHGTRQRALAIVDNGLTLFASAQGRRGGRLSDVTLRRDGGNAHSAESLGVAWRRLGLRDPQLSQIDKVAVLDLSGSAELAFEENAPFVLGSLPAGNSAAEGATVPLRLSLASQANQLRHALDGVNEPVRPSTWQWLTLVAVLLLAGALAAKAVQVHQARDALAVQSSADAPTAHAFTPVAPWTREELNRVQAVNVAVRELNLPIASILQALQPPRDLRVAVVSVDAKSASSEAQTSGGRASSVKVVAEALSGADMARYIAFVGERKPFTAAYLVGHEINEAAREKPYRFTMDAHWTER
jgi:hypothetical protein